MGDVIRFISRSERERARLIRETRATYDRIFPPAEGVSEQLDKTRGGADAHRSDGGTCHDRDHRRALQSLVSGKLLRAKRHHLGLRLVCSCNLLSDTQVRSR